MRLEGKRMAPSARSNGKTVVVALGGNAILQPGQVGTFEEQLFNIDGAMRRIAALAEDGWRVVLTHGNGPQVGNLLIQNALAAKTVAPMPMDVCGAESQGQIGYLAAQTLANHLRKRKLDAPVVCVVTQVAVDPKDKAFEHPSKPVGPFYSEAEAKKMMLEEGQRDEGGRGPRLAPRRALPRAQGDRRARGGPRACSGAAASWSAAAAAACPWCAPAARSSGIDAVIDKDLAAALLARELGAQALLILTDVPRAYVHYGTPGADRSRDGDREPDARLRRRAATSRPAPWAPRWRPACASSTPAARASSPASPRSARRWPARPARTSCRTRRRSGRPAAKAPRRPKAAAQPRAAAKPKAAAARRRRRPPRRRRRSRARAPGARTSPR